MAHSALMRLLLAFLSVVWAQAELGHTVVKAVPSLFTFRTKDTLAQDLSGVSVANVQLSTDLVGCSTTGLLSMIYLRPMPHAVAHAALLPTEHPAYCVADALAANPTNVCLNDGGMHVLVQLAPQRHATPCTAVVIPRHCPANVILTWLMCAVISTTCRAFAVFTHGHHWTERPQAFCVGRP